MTEREPFTVKIDPDVASQFREFVDETKGGVYGQLGPELENAMREYMDRDRYSRIEARQKEMAQHLETLVGTFAETDGTHTHTGHVTPTTVTEKRQLIAADLHDRDAPVFPEREVNAAIRAHAGADDRTLRKYKGELKAHGDAYNHPDHDSEAWTTDPRQFARWAEEHYRSVPDADLSEMLEPYEMTIEEYDRLITAVENETDAVAAVGVDDD